MDAGERRRAWNRWTEERLAYLRENCEKLSVKEMAEHFGIAPPSIRWAMNKYGINKKKKKQKEAVYSPTPPKERKLYYGNPANIGNNQNPVTVATMTLICSCLLDNMTVKQIAMLTERSMEQVREVITEVTESGYMKWIQERREDSLLMRENLTAGRSCVRGRG